MKIKLLGAHNTESNNTRLISLLIDNCLVLDAGGLTSSLSFSEQEKIRAILLTHQHYDHIRDIPAVAMNIYLAESVINVYSILPVYNVVAQRLLDGLLYPNFLELPEGNPTVKFTVVEPHQTVQIEGYSLMAVPVNHSVPTVGYQVTSSDGKVFFYTADTGPDLAECWKEVSPQLLITEVTAPDKYEEFAREAGHLTPGLLKEELVTFRELKGYLPQVVTVHMNQALEKDIEVEIAAAAEDLGSPITLGYEGMQIEI